MTFFLQLVLTTMFLTPVFVVSQLVLPAQEVNTQLLSSNQQTPVVSLRRNNKTTRKDSDTGNGQSNTENNS